MIDGRRPKIQTDWSSPSERTMWITLSQWEFGWYRRHYGTHFASPSSWENRLDHYSETIARLICPFSFAMRWLIRVVINRPILDHSYRTVLHLSLPMGWLKMTDMKMTDHQNCRTWNCRTTTESSNRDYIIMEFLLLFSKHATMVHSEWMTLLYFLKKRQCNVAVHRRKCYTYQKKYQNVKQSHSRNLLSLWSSWVHYESYSVQCCQL